ncbi:MAG: zinc ribbon domain-containing protein [Ktedonobacteraceae bacterium]
MQCPRCNTPLAAGASFCGVCGNALSTPNGGGLAGQPANLQAVHDDRTLVAPVWSDRQPAQTPQIGYQTPPPPLPAHPFPASQAGWSPPQQSPQGAWSPPQQPAYQPQGAYAGNMLHAGVAGLAAPKRRRKWPLRVTLVLLILLVVLAGSWFLGVRPYLNNLAKTQITQAISDAQSQIVLVQPLLPTGSSTIPLSEKDINNYLSTHTSDQLQHMQVTVTPAGLRMDFTVDGLGCTLIVVPIAVNGTIQVTQVQTQGALGLVLSGDELTSILNTSLPNVVQQMNRTIDKVTLQNHVMNIQMH